MGPYRQSHELQDLSRDLERGQQLARQSSWFRKLVPGVNPSGFQTLSKIANARYIQIERVVTDSGASIRSTNSYVVEIMIRCEFIIDI